MAAPSNLNCYRYVANNPLTNTDPSGHCIPGIGECAWASSPNWHAGAAYVGGVADSANAVLIGTLMAPFAISVSVGQATLDPTATIQGMQDQVAIWWPYAA